MLKSRLSIIVKNDVFWIIKYSTTKVMLTVYVSPKLIMTKTCNYILYCRTLMETFSDERKYAKLVFQIVSI